MIAASGNAMARDSRKPSSKSVDIDAPEHECRTVRTDAAQIAGRWMPCAPCDRSWMRSAWPFAGSLGTRQRRQYRNSGLARPLGLFPPPPKEIPQHAAANDRHAGPLDCFQPGLKPSPHGALADAQQSGNLVHRIGEVESSPGWDWDAWFPSLNPGRHRYCAAPTASDVDRCAGPIRACAHRSRSSG